MKWLRNLLGWQVMEDQLTFLKEELSAERDRNAHREEYLVSQLAQRSRRVDELQEALIAIAKPATPALRLPRPTVDKPYRSVPKGWDAFREDARQNPVPDPEPEPVADSNHIAPEPVLTGA
jgi:hypothetical protein